MHQNDFDVSEKSNHLIFSGSKKKQISTCNSLRWVLQHTAVILTQKSNIEYTLHSQNPQCGNFMIFLSFTFYVKSISENLDVRK